MKILIFLVLIIPTIFASSKTIEQFAKFVQHYGKQYQPAEFKMRYDLFKNSLEEIDRLNREAAQKGLNTKFGVTKFSDLSKEEFKAKYMGYVPSSHANVDIPFEESVAPLPTSFDWRTKGAVTPVKNQEQCGSCWAFSATEGVESAWFLAKSQLVVLSPQQIVSCDQNDDGCNGGDLPTAFQYVQQNGMETCADYPYTSGNGNTGTCQYDSSDVVVQISGFKYATQSANETQMRVALLAHGPLSICVDASTWQNYQGGVITHGCGDDLDHCVQIVGFSETTNNKTPYWIIRNSWGTDWGLNGYLWVERGKDECGVSDEATYVTI